MTRTMHSSGESGFVLVILLTAIIPLVAMAAAATLTMGGRNQRIMQEVQQERALLAAEAGIDEAVYAAQTGGLVDGTPIERDFGKGSKFTVEPTYLYTDGADNDGDGDTDSADPDEKVFQLIVTGYHRQAKRRFAAFLGPAALLPIPEAAIGCQAAPTTIEVHSAADIIGNDTKLDGTPGDSSEDVAGMSIAPPETVNALSSQLDATESLRVVGTGSAPSLLVSSEAVDVAALGATLEANATSTLTNSSYDEVALGLAIHHRTGNLVFDDDVTGSGILVVTGDLTLQQNARFDGVVVVGGKLTIKNTAAIYGAVFVGGLEVKVHDSAKVVFSKEGVLLADGISSAFMKLQGWQEISRG